MMGVCCASVQKLTGDDSEGLVRLNSRTRVARNFRVDLEPRRKEGPREKRKENVPFFLFLRRRFSPMSIRLKTTFGVVPLS